MSTASGAKTLTYNTLERLVSDDPNRAQSFAAQALAEALRFMYDQQVEADMSGCGYETMGTGTETNLRATIIGGLRFRPDMGVGNLAGYVTPGAALFIDNPSPILDDSVASFVADPGVSSPGTLALTPGTGGSTRIDVVECQRISEVIETDNRDIFAPATGVFAPALVTKVMASQLQYRIRTGTPGSGFPGLASGWLPIAVLSVPSGATYWDNVRIWDVRPLASDRINAPFTVLRTYPKRGRTIAYCNRSVVVGTPYIRCYTELEWNGYRAGGLVQTTGNVATYPKWFDLSDNTHWEPGFAFGDLGYIWNVFLMFPFGLPRWVEYTPATESQRVPGKQRGIAVLTHKQSAFNGTPLSLVSLPASTGLLGSGSYNGILAFAGRDKSSGSPDLAIGMNCDGKAWFYVNPDPLSAGSVTTPSMTGTVLFTITAGVDFCGAANAVYVRVSITVGIPLNVPGLVTNPNIMGKFSVTGPDGLTSQINPVGIEGATQTAIITGATGGPTGYANYTAQYVVRVPTVSVLLDSGTPPTPQPQETAARTFVVTWTYDNPGDGSMNVSTYSQTVLGWELGPG